MGVAAEFRLCPATTYQSSPVATQEGLPIARIMARELRPCQSEFFYLLHCPPSIEYKLLLMGRAV